MNLERETAPGEAGAKLRATFLRVMAVQIVALLLLWFLQASYGN